MLYLPHALDVRLSEYVVRMRLARACDRSGLFVRGRSVELLWGRV